MKQRLQQLRQSLIKAYADRCYKRRGLSWYVQQAQVDSTKLVEQYKQSSISQKPDNFALIRILGNDLYPRHRKGQTYDNLKFVLENEENFPDCEKFWIVNRIVCPEEESRIEALLKLHNQAYEKIPYDQATYQSIERDFSIFPTTDFLDSDAYKALSKKQQIDARAASYHTKNKYVMNNNGARNHALRLGKSMAKWVLPWDGNCFLTPKAWSEISGTILKHPQYTHFLTPMARVNDNQSLLDQNATPPAREEPQVIFRADSTTEFNEEFYYGRRPKVELFWTLGIPGPWDTWEDAAWDPSRREVADDAFQFSTAGWVARTASGMPLQEQGSSLSGAYRTIRRQEAIMETLEFLTQNNSSAS